MKRRAFICARQDFPRGSAGANYIQYLAMAFNEMGYTSIVISSGRYDACTYNVERKTYEYNGIELYIPFKAKNKIIRHFEYMYANQFVFTNALKKYKLNSNDIVVSYLTDKNTLERIREFAYKRKAISIACIVEWLSRDVFSSDKSYQRYCDTVANYVPKYDIVLPISSFIRSKYESKNCNILTLPIMADVSEYEYKDKRCENEINIIFPANGKMKDSIDQMLLGVDKALRESNRKIKFHITNFNEEKLKTLIVDYPEDTKESIVSFVKCYSWLEYDELISLYQTMDFLLLARKTEQMSLANFPSKVPEAMTYGVIPIVSDVGDYTKYYLKDGYDSIIFSGYDSQACVEAVKRVLELSDSEIHEMRVNARHTAENRFDYHSWTQALNNVIERTKKEKRNE